MNRIRAFPALILPIFLVWAGSAAAATAESDVLLSAMRKELKRSFKKLKSAEKTPMYYLGYEAWDHEEYYVTALLGDVRSEFHHRTRSLNADVRIGTPKLDNTHQIKGRQGWYEWPSAERTSLVTDDDEAALRADIWLVTDKAYKSSRERYTKVETNKAVTAEEEDKSDDFSVEDASSYYGRAVFPKVDEAAWRERVKRLSAVFKKYPFIISSAVSLDVETFNRYITSSEGSDIVTGNTYVRLSYSIKARTEDGMDLRRHKGYDAADPKELPDEASIIRDMETSAAELEALHKAPLTEPFTGPAIFRARAAAVYFHEILGHRLEGHRQKLEEEGQTFAKKLGQKVTADFISVYDDATLDRFRGTFLRGYYKFDDEGIPARRVTLVENGVLKGFLMSRSPIKGFSNSNGHGRRSSGKPIVARMGNTMIEASETMPYEKLREKLIEEIKKRNKPYGLIFNDISGGYTTTRRYGPQSFKVIPLLVYRVYPDGRPDEPVRGVDIVGTPLMSFTKIIAAADDYDIFNGTCGAESGWVPVSGVAPSLLFSEIEVEKKLKFSEKPPVLPPPFHDKEAKR